MEIKILIGNLDEEIPEANLINLIQYLQQNNLEILYMEYAENVQVSKDC